MPAARRADRTQHRALLSRRAAVYAWHHTVQPGAGATPGPSRAPWSPRHVLASSVQSAVTPASPKTRRHYVGTGWPQACISIQAGTPASIQAHRVTPKCAVKAPNQCCPQCCNLHAPRGRQPAAPPRRPRSCISSWHNSFIPDSFVRKTRGLRAGRARPAAPLPSTLPVHAQGSRAAAPHPAHALLPTPQRRPRVGRRARARARSHVARRLRARLEERDLRAQLVQLGQVGGKPGAQLAAAVHSEEGEPVDAQVARDKVGQRGVRAVHLQRAARRGGQPTARRPPAEAARARRSERSGPQAASRRPQRCREATLPSARQPADPTLPYCTIAGPRTDRKVTSGLLRASFFSPGYSRRQPGHQGTQKSATSRRWPATAARYAAGLAAGSRFRGSSPSHLVRSRLQRQPGLAARGGARAARPAQKSLFLRSSFYGCL